jgi:hypothetical protein
MRLLAGLSQLTRRCLVQRCRLSIVSEAERRGVRDGDPGEKAGSSPAFCLSLYTRRTDAYTVEWPRNRRAGPSRQISRPSATPRQVRPLFSRFSRVKSTDASFVGASTALAASTTAPPAREPVIRVNTANLTELKNAVDDHLKLVLSSPEQAFKRSYVHDDVRLAVGWTAVGVAVATGYYSYVVDDFHRTKHWVAVGVVVCVPFRSPARPDLGRWS